MIDEIGHILNVNDDANLTPAYKKFGSSALYLPGTNDYVKLSNSTDFNFGTNNFTIECWVRFTNLSTGDPHNLFAYATAGGSVQFYITDAGAIGVWAETSAISLGSGSISLNTWYHVAIVRNGNTWIGYLDGTITGSVSDSRSLGNPNHANGIMIGAEVTAPSQWFNGYIDEFRISSIARWTSNFTPSSTAYTTDGNTLFLSHCDGLDDAILIADTEVSNVQKKFGTHSLYFPGTYNSYVTSFNHNETDFTFSNNDFTIDWWEYRTATNGCTIATPSNYTYPALLLNYDNGNVYISSDNANWDIASGKTFGSVSLNTWVHYAITRNGNTFRTFKNGIKQDEWTSSLSLAAMPTGYQLGVGSHLPSPRWFAGYIDEIRISKGIARWTSDFTPESSPYTSDGYTTLLLHCEPSPSTLSINETINIDDSWIINTNPGLIDMPNTVYIDDDWTILTSPIQESFSHTINILDTWTINFTGILLKIVNTNLVTVLESVTRMATDLRIGNVGFIKYATNLALIVLNEFKIKTDLRVLPYVAYPSVLSGTLTSYVVKLDGTAFGEKDIDFESVNITMSLNSTPSRAEFVLCRRHDDLNRKFDGSTSTITNENKIEIYDGTTKLFTGYITEIFANSTNDTVSVIAEDVRYKLALNSMELKYGGDWLIDSNDNGIPDIDDTVKLAINDPSYIRFEKNIGQAYSEIVGSIGSFVSGYDSLPFSGSFVPEYVKTYNNYAALLDEIIKNTSNTNWYIDANERLRFQVVGQGQQKTLNLSSINAQRHPYDTIINDIRLNKKLSSYAASLVVKLGKHIKRVWNRTEYSGIMNVSIPPTLQNVNARTLFDFQQWNPPVGQKLYVGINQTIYGYLYTTHWVLKPSIVVQWLKYDLEYDVPDIIVGSGEPKKTLYLTSYGIKEENERWEEKNKTYQQISGGDIIQQPGKEDEPYLVRVQEETWNYTNFATDIANFELSQNNKLLTTATITILLDAYKYYNIQFSDLLNLGNTTVANIYNNNNGFPLNIESMQFNLGQRSVTLNLSNYGKNTYTKTTSYLSGKTIPKIYYWMEKQPIQYFNSGL